jgi:DNA-binding NarL/FixJ family response regulator
MRILLADDSEIVRRRLAALLGDIPHIEVVGEAGDVTLALTAFERLHPDIVIVDLHMPGNGFRLVEALGERRPKATILVLTNYPYPQYRDRSLAAGADYFFDKSTEFLSVVRVLKDLAYGRGIEDRSDA